ncbi:GSCOCT00014172001.2-RA-CDS, partial [Cotesia congregata]
FKIQISHSMRKKILKLIDDIRNPIDILTQSCGKSLSFNSLFIMCLNGYLIVSFSDNKPMLMRAIIYLSGGFLQLLYWCALGNELKYQADNLTTSQWMSGWENNYHGGINNLVTTAMIKTMQPLEMRAGGLFALKMETFISILKSSYSVFVLMTTVSG